MPDLTFNSTEALNRLSEGELFALAAEVNDRLAQHERQTVTVLFIGGCRHGETEIVPAERLRDGVLSYLTFSRPASFGPVSPAACYPRTDLSACTEVYRELPKGRFAMFSPSTYTTVHVGAVFVWEGLDLDGSKLREAKKTLEGTQNRCLSLVHALRKIQDTVAEQLP